MCKNIGLRNKIFSVGIASLLLLSCSDGNNKQTRAQTREDTVSEAQVDSFVAPDPIKLKISISKATPLSSLPVSQTIIFNETEENFIGEPSCIVVRGDTIFAIDSRKAPGFYAYLRNGSLLWAYTSKGQGPEDFYALENLNVTDTEISAFDYPSNTIFVLNKKGEFVERIPTPRYSVSAAKAENGGVWVDFSNFDGKMDDIRLGWAPPGGRTDSLVTVLSIPEHFAGISVTNNHELHRNEFGEWLHTPSFDRYIYSLHNNKAYIKYEMDFGRLWWDDEKMSEVAHSNESAVRLRDFPIQTLRFFENNNWVVIGFKVRPKKTHHVFVYNKTTQKGTTYIDKEDKYLNVQDLFGDELFLLRNEDANLEVITLNR